MARVSIDGASSSSASTSTAKSSSKSRSGGGGGDGGGKKPLDNAQKIKAAVAVVIIAIAGVFIAWNNGLFEGRPQIDPNAPPDATPQEQAAFEENQKKAAEQQRSTGNTRLPPMPLGSN